MKLLYLCVIVSLVFCCMACSHRQQKKSGRIIEKVGCEIGEAIGKGAFFILTTLIEDALKPKESSPGDSEIDNSTEVVIERGVQVYPDSECEIVSSLHNNYSGWLTDLQFYEKRILKSVRRNTDYNDGYIYGWNTYKTNFDQYVKISSDNSYWYVGALQAMREIHLSRLAYQKTHK